MGDICGTNVQEVGEPVLVALAYCLKADIRIITAGETLVFEIHPVPTSSITLAFRPGFYCSFVPSVRLYPPHLAMLQWQVRKVHVNLS